MSLKKICLHDPVDQHNRTQEPCINDVGVKVADITVAGMARVFVSLAIMTCWQLMWLTKK